MQYKLIRTDSVEQACKIELPNGIHLVGRGPFFNDNIDDKRVSRKHAELEVTDDSVSLKSLHSNPCFYITKDSNDIEVIKQNDTKILHNGDKFGILPKSYWYELIKECKDVSEDIPEDQVNKDVDANTDSQRTIADEVEETLKDVTKCDFDDSFDDKESVQSQSLLTEEPQNDQITENYNSEFPSIPNDLAVPTMKRENSDEESLDGAKKVKTEHEEPQIKKEPPELVKNGGCTNDAATAGPSNDQGSPSKDPNSPSPAVPNLPRERCIYGGACYRRNMQHKAQFSHPCDADWAQGENAVCPFGRDCRRRNPRHWTQVQHPPGTQPPPPQGNKKRRTMKWVRPPESEDDEVMSSLIVIGKRARKTVQLATDANRGSSSESEDPYATDDSDEWQPSSDFVDTQDF